MSCKLTVEGEYVINIVTPWMLVLSDSLLYLHCSSEGSRDPGLGPKWSFGPVLHPQR